MRRRLRALLLVRRGVRVPLPVFAGVAVVAGLVGVVLLLLGPVAWLVAGSTVRGIPDLKSRADAINTVRGSLLTAAAGIIAGAALYFTARNYYLARRGQVTDRYTTAIALLASDKAAERIGGIYALEHVLRESPVDHGTVVDVLAAYIRDRAPAQHQPPPDRAAQQLAAGPAASPATADPAEERRSPAADVQAALTVLGRRPDRPEATPLDLRDTDLQGAELRRARFAHALLTRSQLDGADLNEAQLQAARLDGAQLHGATLHGAQLQDATLREARLQGATLYGAQLQRATLYGAQLQGATLSGAQLQGAYLHGAQLQLARLEGAQLQGATLEGAQLQGAYLHGAQLQDATLYKAQLQDAELDRADLRGVLGLGRDQVQSAVWGDELFVVDDELFVEDEEHGL